VPARADRLFAALRQSGMSEVPGRFSVVPSHQEVPRQTLAEIEAFIRLFDRVTTRRAWCEAVTASAPEITRPPRREVCFFSAWDFHLPSSHPAGWQLIECNDNGSGFLFAGRINRVFYEVSDLASRARVEPPLELVQLGEHVTGIVEREAVAFFGEVPRGLFLILDDAESLAKGRFRDELSLLRALFRDKGWASEIAAPEALRWSGDRLLAGGREVSFVVNRSTDFFFREEVLSPLREAYAAGRVYVAPNPFTYATRSDKRLLLTEDNLEALARRKDDVVFKPCHGFAGRGVLPSAQVGRSRLRRLLRQGEPYVAQRRVPKHRLTVEGGDGSPLWGDLRVWSYRGERFLVSGRASRRPDRIDLAAPGGWLPTYPSPRAS
jgi:hypothetical protein